MESDSKLWRMLKKGTMSSFLNFLCYQVWNHCSWYHKQNDNTMTSHRSNILLIVKSLQAAWKREMEEGGSKQAKQKSILFSRNCWRCMSSGDKTGVRSSPTTPAAPEQRGPALNNAWRYDAWCGHGELMIWKHLGANVWGLCVCFLHLCVCVVASS